MNLRARAVLLAVLLAGTAPLLAWEEDESEDAPPMPTAGQAAGIRAALDNPDPAVQREAFRILAQTGWAAWPGQAPNKISLPPAEAAARLDDPDPDVCRAAVTLLGNMGLAMDSPWAKKIAALRADRRSVVAQAAVQSRRRMETSGAPGVPPPTRSFDETFRELSDPDLSRRATAAEALIVRRGEAPEAARAAAVALASDEKSPLHPVVADLLRRAPGPAGTLPGEIAALLRHADATVRCAALQVLGPVAEWNDAHVGAIGALLDDADPAVRAEAARALARSHAAAPFAAALAACLADPEAGVREGAAGALGQLGPAAKPHLPALVALLSDAEPDVRLGAMQALLFLDEATAHAEEIVALLGAPPAGGVSISRDAAAYTLKQLGDLPPAALRALAARCVDSDPEVRALAIEALGMRGRLFVERTMRTAGEPAAGTKPDFSRWSGGPAAAFAPVVAARLNDSDRQVRTAAVDALGDLGLEGAVFVREVAARLRDPDPETRGIALRTLGRMGSHALPFAREIAARRRDPVPGVRSEAAQTLGRLPGDFAALLLESARDPAAEVRHSALSALDDAILSQPAVTAAILARLEDRDEGVRGVASSRLDHLARRQPSLLSHLAARLADPRPAARQATVRWLDALAEETAEAGLTRDFLVAVLRALPSLGEEERARLRAHLHVWAGQFSCRERMDLQPAVTWLGRPRRTPLATSLRPNDARAALFAFREVWDGADGKRDAILRRETAQRAAEVAAALPAAPDEATVKVLEEWSARLGACPEFKDCRRAFEGARKNRSGSP